MSARYLSISTALTVLAVAGCAASAQQHSQPAAAPIVAIVSPVADSPAPVAAVAASSGDASNTAAATSAKKKVTPRPAATTTQVYVTGSRIGISVPKKKPNPQTAQPGQSVSAQELELTGHTDAGSALRGLVPRMAPMGK